MNKLISLFTMIAFIIFSLSCYSTKSIKLDADAEQKVKKGEILRVVKKSGEIIEFSKEQPGRIHNGSITGITVRVSKEMAIDKADVESLEKEEDWKFLIIVAKDVKIYKDFIGAVMEEKEKYIFNIIYETSESVSILLSEVETIRVRESSPGKTVLAVVTFIGIPLLIWILSWSKLE